MRSWPVPRRGPAPLRGAGPPPQTHGRTPTAGARPHPHRRRTAAPPPGGEVGTDLEFFNSGGEVERWGRRGGDGSRILQFGDRPRTHAGLKARSYRQKTQLLQQA